MSTTSSDNLETYSAGNVANTFLALASDEGREITPLTMQKLVYFAHGWHLVNFEAPLIREPIIVWPYGPVIFTLYDEFREFGRKPITRRATEFDPFDDKLELADEINNSRQRALVQKVWDAYKEYDGLQLSAMTHRSGSPWDVTMKKRGLHAEIPDELIKEVFEAGLHG